MVYHDSCWTNSLSSLYQLDHIVAHQSLPSLFPGVAIRFTYGHSSSDANKFLFSNLSCFIFYISLVLIFREGGGRSGITIYVVALICAFLLFVLASLMSTEVPDILASVGISRNSLLAVNPPLLLSWERPCFSFSYIFESRGMLLLVTSLIPRSASICYSQPIRWRGALGRSPHTSESAPSERHFS